MNAVQIIAAVVALIGGFVAARSLVRLRTELRTEPVEPLPELDPAEEERIRQQVQAEEEAELARLDAARGEQVPWR